MYGDPVPNRQIYMFAMAIWDLTAKFNSRQYFQLYSIYCVLISILDVID